MSRPRVVMVAIGGPRRASSRLRVHAWLPRLDAAGIDTTVFALHPDAGTVAPPGGLLGPLRRRSANLDEALRERSFWDEVIAAARGAAGVFLQETIPPRWATEALRRTVPNFVLDFSDPIHRSGGPGQGLLHRTRHRLITLPRFHALLDAVDAVVLENDDIRDFAGRGGARVEVMRGPMDTDFYRPRGERDDLPVSADDRPIVGWTGSDRTLRFLEPLLPTLRRVARDVPFRLHVVGTSAAPDLDGLDVLHTPWEMEAEARAVAGFDVGLAWLPDTPWTRLRGGAKLIVYMAAGVPVVTSPVGIGDQVVTPGREGFLATTDEEWETALRTLLTDPGRRGEMAASARRSAVEQHGYDAVEPLLRELLGV